MSNRKTIREKHNIARLQDADKCPLRTEMTDLLESHSSITPHISKNVTT